MQYHDNDPHNADIETMFGTHEELTADAIIDEAEADFAAAEAREVSATALINIGTLVGLLRISLESDDEDDDYYVGELIEAAYLFEKFGEYYEGQMNFDTAAAFVAASEMRQLTLDLSKGLTRGTETRETVVDTLGEAKNEIIRKANHIRN